MKNKTIANWLIGIIALSFSLGFFGIEDEGFTIILGLFLIVFGIIAIVRLYKLPELTK